MAKKKQSSQAQAALAKARAEQERKARRTRVVTWGVVGVVVAGLVVGAGVVIGGAAQDQAEIAEAAESPIPGVEETPDQSANHVPALPEPVASAPGTLLPPTGGEHDPVWLNCGVYNEPVPTFNAVHSLEHGAVWVTYMPGLAESEVAALEDAVAPYDFTVLSPFEELAAPIVLTAWGVQLELDDTSDERLETFLAKYVLGEQTPELGASCVGGIGNPA